MSWSKLKSNKNRASYLKVGLFVILFAYVGVKLLTVSHGTTPSAFVNADSGTLSGPATKQACSGSSDGSCIVFGSPTNDNISPTPPSNLSATSSSKQINLSWNASTDTGGSGLAGYKIYRSAGADYTNYAPIATAAASATTYTDSTVASGSNYNYFVVAYDGAGNLSSQTNVASASVGIGTIYYANPGDNIQSKVSALKPGDTLIFNDGTYNQLYLSPGSGTAIHGTAAAVITLRAAHDGKAIFDGGGTTEPFYVTGSSYVTFQGFVVRNSSDSVVVLFGAAYGGQSNDHLTLQRITAYGAADGNNHVFSVQFPQTNILIEDSAAWGQGRYKFLAYHSSNVTFRRDWAYYEGFTTWTPAPRSDFGVYGSQNVTLENDIGLHDIPSQSDPNFYTAVWETSDDTTNYPTNNTLYAGDIFYNNCGGIHVNASAGTNTQMKDLYVSTPYNSTCVNDINSSIYYTPNSIEWDTANGGSITNATIANSDFGFYRDSSDTPSLSNLAIINNSTAFFNDPGHSYSDFYGNGSLGTNLVSTDKSVNPGYDTATYGQGAYLFVPSNSPLKGAGANGADMGAHIIYEYVNGQLTSIPLWPWPMESRVMTEKGVSPTWSSKGGLWDSLNGVY